jgi:predicted RNA binding protein YcfA (HicA-like mRNA interferase family)
MKLNSGANLWEGSATSRVKDEVKAFEKAGWLSRGQVGSHRVLTKPDIRSNLTVPMHSELAQGTLRPLIKVAGLAVDQFLELL